MLGGGVGFGSPPPPPPTFNLIPVVLNKVIEDNADLVLVAPIWQAQPW